jgi:hypothetical protein
LFRHPLFHAAKGFFVAFIATAATTTACGSSDTKKTGAGGAAGTAVSSAGAAGLGATSGGGLSGAGGVPFGAGGSISFGAGGAPTACKMTGEACQNSLDCCDGAACNNTSEVPALNGCHPGCTQSSDCATGCCVKFSNGNGGICADAMWCSCGMDGTHCGTMLPQCCSGQTCLAGDAMRSFYECKKICATNADCTTNCCVPLTGLNMSACLDPMYCPAPPTP